MHQNSQNFDSNIHFRPSGLFGGALGAQNGFWASPGGKSEARALVFFLNALYWSPKQAWGVSQVRF